MARLLRSGPSSGLRNAICRSALFLVAWLGVGSSGGAVAASASTDDPPCARPASDACYFSFRPLAGAGLLHYYASATPDTTGLGARATVPTSALIVVHGRSRDANKTFDAALEAVQQAGVSAGTLVVAPVFQVGGRPAERCRTSGVPYARPHDDLLWTCASWMDGAAADDGGGPTSFLALERLVAHVADRWPEVRVVTIAGFSAGARMVQHAIGFAAPPPAGVRMRYVVADPGSWVYFDPVRPVLPAGRTDRSAGDLAAADWLSCVPDSANGRDDVCPLRLVEPGPGCPAVKRWKYGTDGLPAAVGADAANARTRYAAADIDYLEADGDTGAAPGTAFRVLDTSCAAMAQGPFRLQRGIGYAYYDRTLLAPSRPHRLTLVPGCGHDVACVFRSAAARLALTGIGGTGREAAPPPVPLLPPTQEPSEEPRQQPFRPRP